MSEKNNPSESEVTEQQKQGQQAKPDKIKKLTNYMLGIVAFMLLFSIVSDRIIPSTDNARVKGYVVPIKPQVSGQVLDIVVQPNQLVKQGDVLAR